MEITTTNNMSKALNHISSIFCVIYSGLSNLNHRYSDILPLS